MQKNSIEISYTVNHLSVRMKNRIKLSVNLLKCTFHFTKKSSFNFPLQLDQEILPISIYINNFAGLSNVD